MVRSKRKANRGKLKKRKDCSFQEKIYGVVLIGYNKSEGV